MVNPKTTWSREDNHRKLLSLLREHEQLTFGDLKNKLSVSEPTLTEYIKDLEEENWIEPFFKPEDRRQRWYRIKVESKEKVDSQLGKYEAIKFIEGIPNPIYIHREKGKRAIGIFMSPEGNNIAIQKKMAEKVADSYLGFAGTLWRFYTKNRNLRVATIVMDEI